MTVNDGDDLEIANPDDFFIQRDDDGDLVPVQQRLPGREKAIRVIPMSNGDIAEYWESLDMEDPEPEVVAQIFNEFLPDLSQTVTARMVDEELIGMGVQPLLFAILNASGYDMQKAFMEENLAFAQQVQEAGNLTEELPEE